MSRMVNETIGSMEYDELIIGNHPVADVAMVKLAAGQGIIKRGTVLSGTPGGELAPISKTFTAGTALYILTDDTDTGDTPADDLEEEEESETPAIFATAYRSGKFNRKKLLTDGTYTLSDADIEALRQSNIILDDMV